MKRLLFVVLLSFAGTAAADLIPPPEQKEPAKTAPAEKSAEKSAAKTAPAEKSAEKSAAEAAVDPSPKKSGCSLDGESAPSSPLFLIAGLFALGYARSRVAR